MCKKFVIFSPINKNGGIGLEVAFIAKILDELSFEYKVISLGDFYEKSSVFYFNKNLNYNSIDRILYSRNFFLRLITQFLGILKPLHKPKHFRIENGLSKILGIRIFKIKLIEKEIKKVDVIILASQLTSKFNEEIIELAYLHQKKILFRVTGQIHKAQFSCKNNSFLQKVSLFIQHSKKNKELLQQFLQEAKQTVIDQTALNEKDLLQIPIHHSKNHYRFFTLSRLDKNKNVQLAIEAFLRLEIESCSLHIYGDGSEKILLESMAATSKKIFFHGNVEYSEINTIFNCNDCLIIPSFMEAGPLTGIEAMAAGKLILTSRVGAMEERLSNNYTYFFNTNNVENLIKAIGNIIGKPVESNLKNREKLREIYLSYYSNNEIINKYKSCFL